MADRYVILVSSVERLPHRTNGSDVGVSTSLVYCGDDGSAASDAMDEAKRAILSDPSSRHWTDTVHCHAFHGENVTASYVHSWDSGESNLEERARAMELESYDYALPLDWFKPACQRAGFNLSGHIVWDYSKQGHGLIGLPRATTRQGHIFLTSDCARDANRISA